MTRELPGPEFWALIHPHTGAVHSAERTARGYSSDLTALIDCERGRFFVKAMRNRPGGRRDSILREREIGPSVEPVSPTVRWQAEDGRWIVLGFEAVSGRRADFAPGSPDLPVVVGLLDQLAGLGLPDVARDWPETRWDRFAPDDEEALFRGDALLHADVNPSNVVLGDGDAWLVDWGWPTRGAGFIDPAQLVVQLISGGHSPAGAESWAARCAAWRAADPNAVNAFAAATVRMHREVVARRPDAPWLGAMAEAANTWAEHRGVTVH